MIARRRYFILLALILELFYFVYSNSSEIFFNILFACPLIQKGTLLIYFAMLLVSTFEVLVVLIPIYDIWQLEYALRLRATKWQYLLIGYRHQLGDLAILLILLITYGSSHVNFLLTGVVRLIIVNLLCYLIAIHAKNNKLIFWYLLIFILISRFFLTLSLI